MEDQKRSVKKKKHTGAKVTAGVVILAALLAGGYGLGFGNGSGLLGQAASTQNAAPQQQTQSTEQTTVEAPVEKQNDANSEAAQNDGVLTITVQEDKLVYEGKEVTLAELEESLLKDFKSNMTVEVKDNHAIKAAFDEVTTLLQKLNIPFTNAK